MKFTNVWSRNNPSLNHEEEAPVSHSWRNDLWVWVTVGIVMFGLLGLTIRVLASHQGNPRAFILETPEGVPLDQGWGVGYDGRFAYHIAVNPLGSVVGLDAPNYRYQRLVYPLFVKVLSLGRPELVPWAMIGLNLLAAGVEIYLLAVLLNRQGVWPLWALIVPFSLGFLITIRMNLLEPLALAFALGGWLAYEKDRPGIAVLLFALGGLTKEIALTFPAAIVLWEFLQKDWRRGLAVAAGSFLPYLFLYFLLLSIFGGSAEAVAKSRLHLIPFGGLRFLTDLPSRIIVLLWVVLPALASGLVAIYVVARKPTVGSAKPALLALMNAALISVLPQLTWVDPLAVLRFGLGLMIALVVWAGQINPRILPFLAVLWLPSGAVLLLVPGLL